MKLKNIIAFHINEHGGNISIVTYPNGDFILKLLPNELTREFVNEYKIDMDEVVFEFVKFSHSYGTNEQFYEFQPNFKGFLKTIRLCRS